MKGGCKLHVKTRILGQKTTCEIKVGCKPHVRIRMLGLKN